jgi:hypothetical protein
MLLLTSPTRTVFFTQLEELRVDSTLRKEAVVREREAEEMCLAEGTFPVLLSGGSGSAAARGGGGGASTGGGYCVLRLIHI